MPGVPLLDILQETSRLLKINVDDTDDVDAGVEDGAGAGDGDAGDDDGDAGDDDHDHHGQHDNSYDNK